MSRYVYQGTMRDGHGHVILDGTVSVYLAGTTTAADVYEASTGGTAVNSVTSSSTDGTFAFYVDLDAYDAWQLFKVVLSKAGFSTSTYDNIAIITPVFTGGLAGKVDLDGSNLALGSDADGDMYYRSGGVLARLPKGDVGQSLVMGAALPAWDDTLAGKMELDGSNLAIGLDADGDIYYRSSGTLTRLPKGTAGHLLTMGADVPGWSALAQVDHGSLAGLSDDDHTQYVRHNLTTAQNDVLVGNSVVGTWVKKTIEEFKTILGLGTAAYTASTAYAPSAKGVTNGNSHDHSEGDGGAIPESGLSIADVTTGNVTTTSHGFVPKAPNDTAKFLRGDGTWAAGGGVTDHGLLTGLADDDHTQYHNDTRGDARYSLSGHNHTGTYEPASSDFTSKVSAASDSAAGKVELATASETTTGTDTGRAVTPDGLAGSNFGKRVVEWFISDPGASLSVGDGKAYFVVPDELNGMNLVRASATVVTAGTTNSTTIQIANVTDSVDMLSTVMSIETTETSTRTSASPGVIDTTHDDVATGDVLRCDIDAVSTTAPKGLIIEMVFQLP